MDLPDLSRRADEVAPLLLGCLLWRGEIGLRLTEVEAYLGPDDPASHAYRGPRGRAVTMYGPPGRLYVYLSYGIHLAANIVCSPRGSASAVLLRSAEIIAGADLARSRRGRAPDADLTRLASGPGNLGQVLGLSRGDDGLVLGDELVLAAAPGSVQISSGPRVGISVAADWPLRFWITDDPSVSAYRRSPRAPRPGDEVAAQISGTGTERGWAGLPLSATRTNVGAGDDNSTT